MGVCNRCGYVDICIALLWWASGLLSSSPRWEIQDFALWYKWDGRFWRFRCVRKLNKPFYGFPPLRKSAADKISNINVIFQNCNGLREFKKTTLKRYILYSQRPSKNDHIGVYSFSSSGTSKWATTTFSLTIWDSLQLIDFIVPLTCERMIYSIFMALITRMGCPFSTWSPTFTSIYMTKSINQSSAWLAISDEGQRSSSNLP